jgi:type IV pilus assembly protein PilB
MGKSRGDFTDILIKKQILGTDQLSEARTIQQQTGAKLQDAIVKLGYASHDEVMQAIAEFHGMPFISLTEVTIPPSVIELVPESVARENVVLPMSQEDGALKIIISDPSDFDTLQKLQFILNKDITPVLAPREQIVEAINRHYGQTETESVDSMLQEFTDTQIDFTETESAANAMAAEDSDAPVVKLVNLIIQEAISLRASDIHVEPFADRIRIRYRIDGVLVERDSPPRRLLAPLVSRIKIMSTIDISEKRRPQDGRIKMTVSGKHFDLRVSILPTNHGQSVVMRLLDRSSIQVNIKDLGFSEDDYKRFQNIIKRPNGIFLVRSNRLGEDHDPLLSTERIEQA